MWELKRIAKLVGFEYSEIMGDSFIRDLYYFPLMNFPFKYFKKKGKRNGIPLDIIRAFKYRHIPTPFDNFLSDSLTLTGYKGWK